MEELKPNFEKRNGLLPAVVQDAKSLEILMLAWVNQEAWNKTLKTNHACFWSTSRNELWEKGATSGNYMEIQEIRLDCDSDAIIYLVEPEKGGACHTQNKFGQARKSCFFNSRKKDGSWTNLEP
jgi:phosphoribosyl-AMP cyclohydrolase